MLNARDLAGLGEDITELYLKLEFDIKKDMFRRLNRLQKVTEATVYQAEILKEAGGLKTYINDLVKQYDAKAQKLLKELFNEAMEKAANNDLKYFSLAKKSFSAAQAQRATAAIKRFEKADIINKTFAAQQDQLGKIENSLLRMTLTVADATETEFLKQCNYAYMKISSGAFSWDKAYKDAVNEQAKKAYADAAINLANDGVKTILYDYSGTTRRYSIESATKMNVLTGINQTASAQTLDNAEALGTDLVEVDAHIGARDVERPGRPWSNHEAIQGRVYCLNGERDFIDGDGNTQHAPNFAEACGFGEPDGICGINCRHSFYPYYEGAPLMYSNKELDEMRDARVELDGDLITPYEAEQRLRICEHNIRTYKAEAQALELTNNINDPRYIKARNGIYKWQENARHIVSETGIKRKYTNEYIGTVNGVQPRGISNNTKYKKLYENGFIRQEFKNDYDGYSKYSVYQITKNGDIYTNNKMEFDTRKLTNYALDINHIKGGNKAIVFKQVLGFTSDNADKLIKQVLEKIDITQFVKKDTSKFGVKYEQILKDVQGVTGRKANVVTGWLYDEEKKKYRLTSIYVEKV